MNTAEIHTDLYSNPLDEKNFRSLRNSLQNKSGLDYADFKKTLLPKYSKFILSGYSFQNFTLPLRIATLILGSAGSGYMIAYLTNFFHEAAHFNISKSRMKNDLLANMFVGILLGQGIKNYRIIHWEHHKNLGQPNDIEVSYFESLSPRFILESFFGIRALKLVSDRNRFLDHRPAEKENELKRDAYSQLIIGLIFHAAVLGLFIYLNQWWLTAEWILSFACFYPLFNSLRQLLEHRNDSARKNQNYLEVPHGEHTRLFGNSPLQQSFGSAGFNKHLLHHLEPNISYTRLNDLQKFLEESKIGEFVKQRQTSYIRTFFTLFNR